MAPFLYHRINTVNFIMTAAKSWGACNLVCRKNPAIVWVAWAIHALAIFEHIPPPPGGKRQNDVELCGISDFFAWLAIQVT